MLISLTESAKGQLKLIVDEYHDRNGIHPYIKLGVRKMGCSGFSHFMELITDEPGSPLIGQTRLFVEKKSLLFLAGTTIDYLNQEIQEGFIFSNPANTGSCHCGKAIYR